MLNPFICGSFNHQQEREEDGESLGSNNSSPCSTPRKSRKGSSKDSGNKNPYSSGGLDKFSALVAELEEKRQQIYSQVGAQHISFVRFVYSSSNEIVPIVVKLKHQKKAKLDEPNSTINSFDRLPVEASPASDHNNQEVNKKKTEKEEVTWILKLKLQEWRRPYYYMPVFIILILVLLALFGRSVAVLCTSIGWYTVPTLSAKTSSSKPAKRKQLVRKFSELSPAAGSNKLIDVAKVKPYPGRQYSF